MKIEIFEKNPIKLMKSNFLEREEKFEMEGYYLKRTKCPIIRKIERRNQPIFEL
jgi:hypothetical protein